MIIESVYSRYSAGSSGNFGNSAAAICYYTVLEILKTQLLQYYIVREIPEIMETQLLQ
ncbi:hypothetical protein KY290_024516 [Solanum tuberosum]|uniref:Uncharacterized protein n=1 Tax=Solanum tuberosum TaxID=4113 RepID=A0ABQ7UQW1_SOLTU|nr:hypothetical protein KY290_024516 [Solanum tuberosum]